MQRQASCFKRSQGGESKFKHHFHRNRALKLCTTSLSASPWERAQPSAIAPSPASVWTNPSAFIQQQRAPWHFALLKNSAGSSTAHLSITFPGHFAPRLSRTAMLNPARKTDGASNPNSNSAPQSCELKTKPVRLHTLLLQYQPASVTPEERENRLGWTQRGERNIKIWVYLPRNLNWVRMFYIPHSAPSSTSTLSKCHLPRRKEKK